MSIGRTIQNSVKAILALISFALGIMTNVTPQQAQSNLSSWFLNPPSWMLPPHVDAWGEIFFFLLGILLICSMLWPRSLANKLKWNPGATKEQNERFRQMAEVLYPRRSWITTVFRKAIQQMHSSQDKFIPINEAARIAYQKTQGRFDTHWIAAVSNLQHETEDQLLDGFAKYVGMTNARLFGIRPLMNKPEEISRATFESIDTEFRQGDIYDRDGKMPRYSKVCIKRSELNKAIAELNAPQEGFIVDEYAGSDEFIAMSAAAREVYDVIHGTEIGQFIKRNFDEPRRVLKVLASYIAGTSIPIFGKHPSGASLMEIDKSILKSGAFQGDGNEFYCHANRHPEFTNIAIRKRDAEKAIGEIKALSNSLPK